MKRLAKILSLTVAVPFALASCDAASPTDLHDAAASPAAVQAAGSPTASATLNGSARKLKGRAIVDVWASPATEGISGITDVRFRGVTRSRLPIHGMGTVVQSRYNARRDLHVLTVAFRGQMGSGANARPIRGVGELVISGFDEEYTVDGNDLFMPGRPFSFETIMAHPIFPEDLN